MLGSFAVGKTSLVQRYINSIFSEKYHTTIGVKIDQKIVLNNHEEINLLLWDIHGEDEYQRVKPAYLMGASGYFVVIDGTRRNTLETGMELQKMAAHVAPEASFIFLLNKADIKEEWEITENDLQQLHEKGIAVMETSAKDGTAVEEAFVQLTQMMINEQNHDS